MTFGEAIEAAKKGQAISRSGWNGKKMYVYLEKGNHDFHSKDGESVQIIEQINGVPITLFEGGPIDTVTRNPYFVMMGAQGNLIPGWLASQTDILAEDWDVLPSA